MKVTTTTGFVGFLLALSTLTVSQANATAHSPSLDESTDTSTIEARLAAITEALRVKENHLQNSQEQGLDSSSGTPGDFELLSRWGNFRNGGHGRWGNFRNSNWPNFRNYSPWQNYPYYNNPYPYYNPNPWGTSFRNVGPWRNGWRDGGGFFNIRV